MMINTQDYRVAPSGDGPWAATWKDKPHRLIYDLCSAIEGKQLPPPTINVKYHDDKSDHIESVGILLCTDDVIILYVDLREKYMEVSAFGGATDSGVQSFWIGMAEVQMKLPEELRHNLIWASTSRYSCYVTIMRYGILEKYSEGPYDEVVLWERPDDES